MSILIHPSHLYGHRKNCFAFAYSGYFMYDIYCITPKTPALPSYFSLGSTYSSVLGCSSPYQLANRH